jgi:hypothetical protein
MTRGPGRLGVGCGAASAIDKSLEGSEECTVAGDSFRLMERVYEALIPGLDKFQSDQAFKVGRLIGRRVLSSVGLNFSQYFGGISDNNIPGTLLRGWTLLYAASDSSILQALGGEEKASILSLAYVYHLMELDDGGPCHVDWQSNFAFVRSAVDGRLWALCWTVNSSNEWVIGAIYVPHPHLDWRANSRVFGG